MLEKCVDCNEEIKDSYLIELYQTKWKGREKRCLKCLYYERAKLQLNLRRIMLKVMYNQKGVEFPDYKFEWGMRK